MKIILGILFFCLLSGCGEPPQKIFPKNGMFPDRANNYDLTCFIEFGKNRDLVNYDLVFNAITDYVEFRQEDWKPFQNVEIVENNPSIFAITIENENDITYQLFKDNGNFGVDAWNNGYCIEKGYAWVIDKSNNTMIYKKN